jgi:hypothetical protein
MNSPLRMPLAFLACLLLSVSLTAQQTVRPESAASAVVPRLVNFSGKAVDAQGKVISGVAGVTFAIYSEESGGAPLWLETQNVQADAKGSYTAQLGATKSEGLPLDLFTSGGARWLGVTVNGGEEQPRILLLSVPYALKAADAQTLGGLPASAFVRATPTVAAESNAAIAAPKATSPSATTRASSDVTTSGGTANAVPLFTTGTNVQNSIMTQTGTSAINVAGKFNHPATGTASATAGKNSQAETFVASAFNKTTNAATAQTFQLQAEPTNNDTTTAGATLNLLFASGTAAPAETGLKIGQRGVITFSPSQTFPGTVTGVTAGSDLTGSESGGKVTLNLDTTRVPLLASENFFTNNQVISATAATWGLTVAQPSYQTILTEGPQSGIGTALEMQTTGTGGMSWQILNTGAMASQGPNKLNFRNDSGGVEVMTMTPTGQVGIGTNNPTATLDVQGNISTTGNATQSLTSNGFVKAMLYVNALNTPYKIVACFNSTLSGGAATTPPCGINFTEDSQGGSGFWDFDFGFEINQRFFSASLGDGNASCISAFPLSSNVIQVFTQDCSYNSEGTYFYIFMY